MATVNLEWKTGLHPVSDHNGQYSALLQKVKAMFGLQNVKFQYKDEEGDNITVDSQFDFSEALAFGKAGKPVKLEVVAVGESQDSKVFIQDLPLTESQLISDEDPQSKVPIDPIIVSEELKDPVNSDFQVIDAPPQAVSVSIETTPVEKAEKEVFSLPVITEETGCSVMTDTRDMATNMDQRGVSSGTDPAETKDQAADAPVCEVAAKASGREKSVSVALETVEIASISRQAGTDPMVHMEAETPEIELRESSIQCEIPAVPLQPFDPNILKSMIQDEIRGLFPKKSLLRSKISLNSVHQGFQCRGCGMNPIKGARFTCLDCENFNLCEDCEDATEHDHVLLKVRIPQIQPPVLKEKPVFEEQKLSLPKQNPLNPFHQEEAIRPERAASILKPVGKEEKGGLPQVEDRKPAACFPPLNPHLKPAEDRLKEQIRQITEMGFTHEQALDALIRKGHNVEAAIEELLS